MIEQALAYYQRAAAVAQRVYANEDAISLLSRSLELLDFLPPVRNVTNRNSACGWPWHHSTG